MSGVYAREVFQIEAARVGGMHFAERLGRMRPEARREARARHGVPLVAHAPGVEHERVGIADGRAQCRRFRRDETRLAIRREEAALGEEALVAAVLAFTRRPYQRLERVERV